MSVAEKDIEAIRAAIKKKRAKWTAKRSELTELSEEEKKRWLGAVGDQEKE